MTLFTIPASIADATSQLNGIEALLTATKWQRAAIVYAFTMETKGGRPSGNRSETGTVSCTEFAALGIKGLKNVGIVAAYRKVFAEQVAAGTVTEPKPGQPLDLSGLPEWVSSETGSHEQYRVEKGASTEVKVAAIEKILEANPEVAAAINAEAEAAKAAALAEQAAANKLAEEERIARLRAEAKATQEKALAEASERAAAKAAEAARNAEIQARKAHLREVEAEAKELGRQHGFDSFTDADFKRGTRPAATFSGHHVVGYDDDERKAFEAGFTAGHVAAWNVQAEEYRKAEHKAKVAAQKALEAERDRLAAEKRAAEAEARKAGLVRQNIESALTTLEQYAGELTASDRDRLILIVAPVSA